MPLLLGSLEYPLGSLFHFICYLWRKSSPKFITKNLLAMKNIFKPNQLALFWLLEYNNCSPLCLCLCSHRAHLSVLSLDLNTWEVWNLTNQHNCGWLIIKSNNVYMFLKVSFLCEMCYLITEYDWGNEKWI